MSSRSQADFQLIVARSNNGFNTRDPDRADRSVVADFLLRQEIVMLPLLPVVQKRRNWAVELERKYGIHSQLS